MTDFKGNDGDYMRIRALERDRDNRKKEFQANLDKISEQNNAGLLSIDQKFGKHNDSVEEQLKLQTIGLVTLEDFRTKRKNIELSNDLAKKL